MKEKRHYAPQVGAPDPERRTSPILHLDDEGEPSLDNELESGACYFNDQRYSIGDMVRSGDELLHCVERGVWQKVMEEHQA
jgi:hypothetical protein